MNEFLHLEKFCERSNYLSIILSVSKIDENLWNLGKPVSTLMPISQCFRQFSNKADSINPKK